MPFLFVCARNTTVLSRDEGADYDRPEAALEVGIQGAVAMVADEIHRGLRSAAVEISIEQPDGTQVLRSVVAISVSPLLPTLQSPEAHAIETV